jgi:hypothetical protein
MAEMKAVKIGQVSRVLKENAVDCYLNTGVNNLSVEKMNQTVKQTLSSGATIDYQVGDKPFSQTCDYMEKCSYVCKPEKDILRENLDTYNENFVELNSEKIMNKIKDLYKEKYIYKKEDLIKEIISKKKYSNLEINNALHNLVNNQNEFLFDMFGRSGTLINIQEYYMFQPIELNNENISRYERVKPIDYKKEKINYKLSKNVKDYILFDISKKKKYDEKVKSLFDEIKNNLDNAYNTEIIQRGEKDWFKFSALSINKLSNEIPKDKLKDYVLHHIIDKMVYNDKKFLIEYLLKNKDDLNDLENKVNNYINNTNKVAYNNKEGYVLMNTNNKTGKRDYTLEFWVVNNNDNTLIKGEKLDIQDFKEELLNKLNIKKSDYNDIIGFMTNIEKIDLIKFKTKEMKLKRNKGARCDQAGKQTNIKILNKILNEEKYTKNNTKDFRIQELCSTQEFILRYYDEIEKDGKKWFLNFEQAKYNDIERINI